MAITTEDTSFTHDILGAVRMQYVCGGKEQRTFDIIIIGGGRLLGSIGTSAVRSAVILVLAGFTVIQATLGGVGRAPAFEVASAVLVISVGIWLLVRRRKALRRRQPQ